MPVLALVLLLSLVCLSLVSCKSSDEDGTTANGATAVKVPDIGDMFTAADRDASYDASAATVITLAGETASASSPAVTVADGIITIDAEGVYKVEGSGANQTIVVDAANAKVRLVLSDAEIVNGDFAALYIKNAEKVFLILEGNNTLSVTGEFTTVDENTVDGVIFAQDDLTVQGDGTLTVSSTKHGIVAKDDLKVTGGTVSVTAASNGIQANDSVRVTNAALTVDSGTDGIQVDHPDDTTKGYVYFESGTACITAGYDGISASGTFQMTGGDISVTAGGGSGKTASSSVSTKGVKAAQDMLFAGGTLTVSSSDDSIHANGSVEIAGGALTLSSGDDGVHADTSLIVSGGDVAVTKSYEGLEAKNITISGGKVSVKASDDGINAAGGNDGSSIGGRPGQNMFSSDASCFIDISGGDIYVDASGDGVDANGSITVSGGTTVVEGPTNSGNGALDYDSSATITGGTFVAVGASGMAMNFSSATQGSILVTTSTQQAGSAISLCDSKGNSIFSMTATKTYSSVLISSPSLTKGASYTLSAGTASNAITLSSLVYGSGSGMGGGAGMGGRPGGGFRP